jgi:hypothetical protein
MEDHPSVRFLHDDARRRPVYWSLANISDEYAG